MSHLAASTTGQRRPRPGAARSKFARALLAAALLASPVAAPSGLAAQDAAAVSGRVLSAESGQPVPGAMVLVRGTERGAAAGEDGTYRIDGIEPGAYELEARALGFGTLVRRVTVEGGARVRVTLELEPRPLEMQGIEVSVLRPDLQPQAELEEREIREANPRDSGELLRNLAGVDAVRRGPLGLDPSVRGLRETEVGTYLDGTRIFPAGPARMDSPLTHLDPSAVRSIDVVKGPYALTWGAGNLSAVRVETRELPGATAGAFGGRLATGYDSNLDAVETSAELNGRSGRLAWWGMGAWRDGNDYETGAGEVVPGDFRSWEGRGKVGVDVAPGSRLSFSGGYQEQGPIDYPGRLLTARFFETLNLSGRWELDRPEGALSGVEVLAYVNDVDHGMDNSGKPTAEPMEGRMPPFALDVRVDAGVNVWGGRAAATLQPAPGWEIHTGVDVYSATRRAVRTIRRAEDGMLLFEDLMWPDATITDGGAFGRISRRLSGSTRLSGTLRLDLVRAEADSVSDFFAANATGDLDRTEASPSAAVTLGYDLDEHWTLSAGLGTAVRTADATERYSDRIPATKAQTSAEFMGNPGLDPERSTQMDVWLEGSFADLALHANAFARHMADYITLEATELPKRLPLSPETVFRYVNGEAVFWGFEASAAYGLSPALTLHARSAYLWGEDTTLDEPALGVAPLRGSLGLRAEPRGGRFFAEGTLHGVAEQERVAILRGETPTGGYATADLKGGVQLGGGLFLRGGVQNLLDEAYVNHLNAKNPFTGLQIPEPGRVFFLDAGVRW